MGFLRVVFTLLGYLITFGASLLTLGCLQVGFATGWSSDGPGMLFVMILTVVFGFVAFQGWVWILGGFTGDGSE